MLQYYINDAKHCRELIDRIWEGTDSDEACISTVCTLVNRIIVNLLKILLNDTYVKRLSRSDHAFWIQ